MIRLLQLVESKEYRDWQTTNIDNKVAIAEIMAQLYRDNYIAMSITNDGEDIATRLSHDYILYHNPSNGAVVRLEQYLPFYDSCITGNDNWAKELAALLTVDTNKRLLLWNYVFTAKERRDNDKPLHVIVYRYKDTPTWITRRKRGKSDILRERRNVIVSKSL